MSEIIFKQCEVTPRRIFFSRSYGYFIFSNLNLFRLSHLDAWQWIRRQQTKVAVCGRRGGLSVLAHGNEARQGEVMGHEVVGRGNEVIGN